MNLVEEYKETLKEYYEKNSYWPQRLIDTKYDKLSVEEILQAREEVGVPLLDEF